MTQKMRLLVSLGGAALVAAVLGAYAFWGVFEPEKARVADEREAAKLFPVDPSAITRLEILAKEETTVLERKEDGWWIRAPVNAPGDEGAIRSLLDRLSSANRKKLLEEKDADLGLFGLDQPAVRIAASAGADEMELLLGSQNTFDGSWFASVRPGEVISVDGWLKTNLEKTTFDLRRKEILDFARSSVQGVRVSGRSAYELRRGEEGWTLTGPEAGPADTAAVDGLLRTLEELRAEAFPSGDAQEHGLEEPALELVLERGELGPLHLRLGAADGKHYAQLEGGPIAEIKAEVLDELSTPPPLEAPEGPDDAGDDPESGAEGEPDVALDAAQ